MATRSEQAPPSGCDLIVASIAGVDITGIVRTNAARVAQAESAPRRVAGLPGGEAPQPGGLTALGQGATPTSMPPVPVHGLDLSPAPSRVAVTL